MSRVRRVRGRKSLTTQHPNAWHARDSRTRRLGFEMLEERALLTVAQDLVGLMTPYQQPLNTALDAAASLPLVGDQLQALQEFDTIFQDALPSIEARTQGINNGHHQLSIPLPSLAKTFTFDLGLDALLQVSAAGGVSAAINPTLNVEFNYQDGSVTLDASQTSLDIGFNLSLPNFQATMSFNGLLFTRAVDMGTNFQGNLGFDFNTGGGLTPSFSGEAHVLMGLSLSFVDPGLDVSFNPTFRTTLDLDWALDPQTNQMLAPSIVLMDFGLDAQSFMDGFLGDVVTTVQKFTKPIQPFVDIFQTPVPIISAFGSSETIGTLMLKGAGSSQAQQDSFTLMMQIIDAVNAIDLSGDTGGAVIPFGTIRLTGDAQQAGAFGFDTSSVTGAIDDVFNSDALQAVEDALETVGNYAGQTSSAGFKFPLLEDPGRVVGAILTGGTESLFSFTTGRQHFELAPSVGVGIPGVLGIFLEAGVVFDANLTMGYDTAGLIAFAADPSNPAHLLHGFYFDNSIDTSVPPRPNLPPVRKTGLYLEGHMAVKGDAVLLHVEGGLYANVSVELVNTDPSPNVHLDTMLANLASGGKVFKLGGKVYASADLSLELSLPIGPDITLFSFNLAYEELLNFDPPAPPSGVPITVIDVTDQHTLLLDATKMAMASRVVTIQPFHDMTVSAGGNMFEADGIRVDYPSEVYLFVERKNNVTTNYYNLVGLNGTAPDGVSVNVVDPFRVFADELAANPYPAQTKPGVLLVGGKDVVYKYSELADGTKPKVLLVGGYGSNTLGGGTMTFGNFIPADRMAQAKAHFADISGYDAAGQALVNSQIDATAAPANPAGIIGATMSGGRGGLMMGGPGNNSFFATGAGVYEMTGGSWVNSFNISPSFSGGPATYQIDGGSYGQSSLVVRVPFDENIVFENAAVPDKYDPAYKALAVLGDHGPAAIAHGIQTVKALASAGSIIEFGDTSEVNAQFSIVGAAHLKFSGTAQPDAFNVDVTGPYYANKNHFTVGDLFTGPASPGVLLHGNPLVPGVGSTTLPDPIGDPPYIPKIYLPTRWADPVYTVKRTFGANGRMQSIPFSVSDADASSITLDGEGGGDAYNIEQGVGAFLDVTIDDSDAAAQNAATVRLRENDIVYADATLTDNSVILGFYTLPTFRTNIATEMPIQFPQFYKLNGYFGWTDSVYYSPTIFFGTNVDVGLEFAAKFQEFVIDRPTALQDVSATFGVSPLLRNRPLPDGFAGGSGFNVNFFPELPLWVYDPDGPSSEIIYLGPAPVTTTLRTLFAGPVIDLRSNAGNLSVDLQFIRGTGPSVVMMGPQIGVTTNIHSNSGTLSFHHLPIFGSTTTLSTFNILSNSGAINFDFPESPLLGSAVNVLANTGTISAITDFFGRLKMNLGAGGSQADIHGSVQLSSVRPAFDVVFDDRNNSAAGRQWTINATHVSVGDLSVSFPTFLGGKLEIRPNAGSTVAFNGAPPSATPINVFGVASGNTLLGPVLASGPTWRIDGPDSGTMQLAVSRELRWQNMETLVGSSGNDTFRFMGGSVSGNLDGGGGFNTLFYDPPPVPFIVNLALGFASLVGGIVSNIQAVIPDVPATLPGDFDGDGLVGASDLPVWQASFGVSATGDADGDNDADGADFLAWQRRLGQQGASPASESVVAAPRIESPLQATGTSNSSSSGLQRSSWRFLAMEGLVTPRKNTLATSAGAVEAAFSQDQGFLTAKPRERDESLALMFDAEWRAEGPVRGEQRPMARSDSATRVDQRWRDLHGNGEATVDDLDLAYFRSERLQLMS